MIDMAGALPNLLSRLKKLETGQGIELLTYKRDRSLRIVKTKDDLFITHEKGFATETHESDLKGMRRLLKALLKKEFPRSNKIRLRPLPPEQETPPSLRGGPGHP